MMHDGPVGTHGVALHPSEPPRSEGAAVRQPRSWASFEFRHAYNPRHASPQWGFRAGANLGALANPPRRRLP